MDKNKKAKRLFVLKNFKTRFIKPVILEMEESENDGEKSDVVREAENIIDSYLKKMGYEGVSAKRRENKYAEAVLHVTIVLGVLAAVFVLLRFM